MSVASRDFVPLGLQCRSRRPPVQLKNWEEGFPPGCRQARHSRGYLPGRDGEGRKAFPPAAYRRDTAEGTYQGGEEGVMLVICVFCIVCMVMGSGCTY